MGEATERFGRVDVLVNNAGVISVGPLLAQRPEDFAEAMAVHFWGTLTLHAKLMTRAAGLAPGVVTEALSLVHRTLPASPDPRRVRGDRIESPVDDTLLTALGRRAAAATNQPPD